MARFLRLEAAVAALVVVMNLPAVRAADDPLYAAVAKADITPEPGAKMWGYSSRSSGATGVLDPLTARALVLKSGARAVAIVTLDLGRTPEAELLDPVRATVRERCGIELVMITASHTHQAPSLEVYDNQTNAYGARVAKVIEELICKAAEDLTPVTMGTGHVEVDYAHNRRRRLADGRIAMQWRNAQREKTSPVDQDVTVVRLNRPDGTALAVLFHYACHPVVLGADNLQYSADYVGAACRSVESDLDTTCLFLQGACGDINPYVDKTPVDQGGVAEMQRMGISLGRDVIAAARDIETRAAGPLGATQQTIELAWRWDPTSAEVDAVLLRAYGDRYRHYLKPRYPDGRIPAVLTTIVLGDELALVGLPGEVFVHFQTELKGRSPVRNTLLVGYADGYHAYFPTIADAAAGGYGGKTATYVEVGAADRLLAAGLIAIHRLRGELNDVPRPEDFRLIDWNAVKNSEQSP